VAVIGWLPTGRPAVLRVAVPPESVPVPRTVAPLENVTVPVGVPVPGAVTFTVAVKVTACPKTVEAALEVTFVVVVAGPTVVVAGAAVAPPAKFPSPLYEAAIAWEPEAREAVVSVAVPPLNVTGDPIAAPLSRKETVPPGVPTPGDTAVTLAVSVTVCPKTGAAGEVLTAVELEALLTFSVRGAEVLVTKLPSPLYVEVIEWLPTDRADVVRLAAPLTSAVAVPTDTPLS
jgi:hypothetical protein